ncbi:endoplasmic reticulum-based factor for assembly of V-ATPase [Metarhizium robertsii]|uniref:ATPase, vacuolar ER assembly factor, Vma12 n=2 Tax=Metarhizium robertsii TaxID=568076 RepID=E9ETI2_METRA|nr:ATPase, vacuolar ER assembly factor, Vma12 [Metarhizium robertsii ARSEF 23]EFZ00735.1 ATPase, vacuolar ER assembly factor, Vma12 [Metarhizium robertsii ARSEF 23]EXV03246.1 endoplasmic reticulum-based factor for assembly of V-ATPase [Metarhizium robertsii]
MVLLTMTASIVDGLAQLDGMLSAEDMQQGTTGDAAHDGHQQTDREPSLNPPSVGKPISHQQIVDIWKKLRANHNASYSLEELLRGSQVYVPPPPPKPEPTEEFKALMARLRHEEAQRAYERMVNPPPKIETFNDRFPTSAQAFSQVNRPMNASDLGDDDVTLSDVHRQVMLIINFLVSILGVAGTLWVISRWWSLPARIFLTMGGSIVVAVAEVAVYSSYMWRMDQAKHKQKAAEEIKQVVNTWVVGEHDQGDNKNDNTVFLRQKEDDTNGTVRKRITTVSN